MSDPGTYHLLSFVINKSLYGKLRMTDTKTTDY